MLLLGLLLVGLGALLVVAAVFTAEDTGGVELLGIEMGALALFLVGVASGVAILWGITVSKFGAKRSLRQRRENRRRGEPPAEPPGPDRPAPAR